MTQKSAIGTTVVSLLAIRMDLEDNFRTTSCEKVPTDPVPVPQFPDRCVLEVENSNSDFIWIVKDAETSEVLAKVPESEIRISISCKFHIFHSKQEVERYKSDEEHLTADIIINTLIEDLKEKGILAKDLNATNFPLYKLAPILVREYILPLSPTSDKIFDTWINYFRRVYE